MSLAAQAALEEARRSVLEAQTVCAFCGKACKDAMHLSLHLIIHHPVAGAKG